jgi:hypothetical protein
MGAEGIFIDETMTLLSFPPDAINSSEGDHLSPHTSYLCPVNYITFDFIVRVSERNMLLSLEPDVTIYPFQSSVPTLYPWLK